VRDSDQHLSIKHALRGVSQTF